MKRPTIHLSSPLSPAKHAGTSIAKGKAGKTQSTQRGNASRSRLASNAERTQKAKEPKVLPVLTLAEQKSDFTSEGAPPPGQVASARHSTVPPALPNDSKTPASAADTAVGTVESEEMQQAHRDVTRGLQDTDRGPEVGRTYNKLKTSRHPTARRKSGR